jgi:hypothetical protein
MARCDGTGAQSRSGTDVVTVVRHGLHELFVHAHTHIRGPCLLGNVDHAFPCFTLGVQYYQTDRFGSSVPKQIRFLRKTVLIGS